MVFAQDFFLYFVPLGLSSLVIWIVLEKVQVLFCFKFVVQADVVRDLVLLLDQIKLLDYTDVVPEFVFAHPKEFLYRVLNASLNLTIVQNVPKSLEYRIHPNWRCLWQHLAALNHKVSSHFNGVIWGFLKEKRKDLQG